MADADHEDAHRVVLDAGDDAAVADAILPEFSEALSAQSFARLARA